MDMQLSYDLTPTDPTDYSFIVRNAHKAQTYGAEMGAKATVSHVFDSDKAVAIYSGATAAQDGANILKTRTYWLGLEWIL